MFLRKLFSYFKQTVKKMFIIMDIALDEKIYEHKYSKKWDQDAFGSRLMKESCSNVIEHAAGRNQKKKKKKNTRHSLCPKNKTRSLLLIVA